MGRVRLGIVTAVIGITLPGGCWAHGSPPIGPGEIWSGWRPAFGMLLVLLAVHLLYGHGVFERWRQAGKRRDILPRHLLAFAAGELALVIALVSPLEAVAGTLFAAHMIQHVLLVAVAPPLLLAGKVDVALFLLFRSAGWQAGRNPVFRALAAAWRYAETPMIATAVHGSVIWLWHAPFAFQAALNSAILHDLEHLSFFLSAMLFWRALFRSGRSARMAAFGALAAFITLLHSGFLGALITFAQHPIYPGYVWTGLWDLSPLEDQQLAGLIMWVPAGLVYLVAGLVLAARVLTPSKSGPVVALPQ